MMKRKGRKGKYVSVKGKRREAGGGKGCEWLVEYEYVKINIMMYVCIMIY